MNSEELAGNVAITSTMKVKNCEGPNTRTSKEGDVSSSSRSSEEQEKATKATREGNAMETEKVDAEGEHHVSKEMLQAVEKFVIGR